MKKIALVTLGLLLPALSALGQQPSAAAKHDVAPKFAPAARDRAIASLKAKTAALIAASHYPTAPIVFRVPGAIAQFTDCAKGCPQMAVIPAGAFTQGSPETEKGRDPDEPQHFVRIAYPFAIQKFDVTKDDYAAFVAATHRADPESCNSSDDKGKFKDWPGRSWRDPGFKQTGRDPVECVSWEEARDYAAWMSKKTGKQYRLPTESEWEYAARAGTQTTYYWGDMVGVGNADCDGCGTQWDNKQTTAVGTFAPNAFGLYDMIGNSWQWVEDCYHPDFNGAPADGSAWESAGCPQHVSRAGSWSTSPTHVRVANRDKNDANFHSSKYGTFRLVRVL